MQCCERWPFVFQKATFCVVICRLLQAKRRHVGNSLIIRWLQAGVETVSAEQLFEHRKRLECREVGHVQLVIP